MYPNQGRRKETTQLTVQVIATRKTKFGEDYPDTHYRYGELSINICQPRPVGRDRAAAGSDNEEKQSSIRGEPS